MARARKRQPWNPMQQLHDRRATELPKVGRFVVCEIDDPYEIGAKIVAIRSTRNDPLADLHSRKYIDEAQYEAGRAYQRDFEAAQQGIRATDPSAPYVDCSRIDRTNSPKASAALSGLAKAHEELGADGTVLMHDFLVMGHTMTAIAGMRGLTGQTWSDYFGKRIRECLHRLAYVYGFAKEKTGKVRIGT